MPISNGDWRALQRLYEIKGDELLKEQEEPKPRERTEIPRTRPNYRTWRPNPRVRYLDEDGLCQILYRQDGTAVLTLPPWGNRAGAPVKVRLDRAGTPFGKRDVSFQCEECHAVCYADFSWNSIDYDAAISQLKVKMNGHLVCSRCWIGSTKFCGNPEQKGEDAPEQKAPDPLRGFVSLSKRRKR